MFSGTYPNIVYNDVIKLTLNKASIYIYISIVCNLFQTSWRTANKKQREKLLELIRRLAEDDKDGVMAHKVRY